MKKGVKIGIGVAAAVTVIVAVVCCWYFMYEQPHNEAVSAFNEASEAVTTKNDELISAINETQAVIDKGETPLDTDTIASAQTAISTSSATMRAIPEMPSGTDEILAAASELNEPLDYSTQIAELNDARQKLEDSIKQLQQVTNPDEAFVTQRLQSISTITGIAACTEDHDPNGELHKSGGYTACIYFSDSQVDRSKIFEDNGDIIDVGTDGGGCIEVFSTAEDAEKRKDYLSQYDGTVFANGSHSVIGTVLVRTSNYLTATQQNDLEAQIIEALIELQ